MKASLHHDPQSNDGVGGDKGPKAVCSLGARSKHRGFLTAGSLELGSDRRLFRECKGVGEKTSWAEVGDGESEWEILPGEGGLNSTTKHDLMHCKMRDTTHKRRLYDRDGTEWGPDGSSEQDCFRFREGWEASSSLSSESVECVSEGVADGLREGGDEYRALARVPGGGDGG